MYIPIFYVVTKKASIYERMYDVQKSTGRSGLQIYVRIYIHK
jgi:hypothetical protein